MTSEEAKFIVRVLTYQRGFTDPDERIAIELGEIRARYNDLKKKLSFQDSADSARAEWLEKFVNQSLYRP